jgi:hypothetical protein
MFRISKPMKLARERLQISLGMISQRRGRSRCRLRQRLPRAAPRIGGSLYGAGQTTSTRLSLWIKMGTPFHLARVSAKHMPH